MRQQSDVIVVGAGIAGAGVAAELSTDQRIVLLEQEEHSGIHATGRSAALHSEIYGNAVIRALSRSSREFFLRGDERPFATARGCLHPATALQLDQLERLARQPSVAQAAQRISGEEARALVPVLRPGRIVAALMETHAYDLDVDAIHRYYLKQVRQNGGVLRCSAAASFIAWDGLNWEVRAGDQTFAAPVLINAAGAWADQVARLAGVEPAGLQPRRRTALTVDPPAGADPSSWPAVIDIGERFYFKPEAGKVLMSPADETPSEPCDAFPDEMDVAIAVERVQEVADIPVRRIAHSWAGLRTFAADRTPVVGYDKGTPSFFWLAGQGGYGIQTSPALSRLAASLVRGGPTPPDLIECGVHAAAIAPARLRAGDGPNHGPEGVRTLARPGEGERHQEDEKAA